MIHIKEQKNGINDINDTKLLDLIKQSSSDFSWSDHPSILSSLTGLSFDLVLVGRIISRACFH